MNGSGLLGEKMKVFACGEIFHMWTINPHILLLARIGLPQSWSDIPLVASRANWNFCLPSASVYRSVSSPSQSVFLNKLILHSTPSSSSLIQVSSDGEQASVVPASVSKLPLPGQSWPLRCWNQETLVSLISPDLQAIMGIVLHTSIFETLPPGSSNFLPPLQALTPLPSP